MQRPDKPHKRFNPAEAEEGFSSRRSDYLWFQYLQVSIQPKPKKGLVEIGYPMLGNLHLKFQSSRSRRRV